MRSRKCRDTLIAKKIIIVAERCLSCWRDMNVKKMIGLKASEEESPEGGSLSISFFAPQA